ncbi:hypothetical protein NM688_g3959 [Phlebia brevispora]|uniref:Uncharacterized protein n=1 Tax=Phlebia brevispora TaxID=194682 RepID=A0ACC1T4G6_9APHY|nr:hypothetical protein NM688_g3959 [Phlebia brevispora]
MDHIASLAAIPPPVTSPPHERLYLPFADFTHAVNRTHASTTPGSQNPSESNDSRQHQQQQLPPQSDDPGSSKPPSKSWKPVKSDDATPGKSLLQRLDLS